MQDSWVQAHPPLPHPAFARIHRKIIWKEIQRNIKINSQATFHPADSAHLWGTWPIDRWPTSGSPAGWVLLLWPIKSQPWPKGPKIKERGKIGCGMSYSLLDGLIADLFFKFSFHSIYHLPVFLFVYHVCTCVYTCMCTCLCMYEAKDWHWHVFLGLSPPHLFEKGLLWNLELTDSSRWVARKPRDPCTPAPQFWDDRQKPPCLDYVGCCY